MSEGRRADERWPELFEGLDAAQRGAVVRAIAHNEQAGWKPTREDVENLVDKARGAIDRAEYLRRVDAAAERHRNT